MSLTTTFQDARAGIITTIVESTSSLSQGSADGWRLVEQVEDVPSLGLRSFFVDLGPPIPTGDIYGGCELHECPLDVFVSYGELPPAEAQVMVAGDAIDLRRSLQGAGIAGVPRFDYEGFEESSQGSGRSWGSHSFTVSLFLPIP